MESDEKPSRYPYLISVRGGRPTPARREGSFYVCAYETFLGLWWSPREVRVLEHDPQRDFLREQRQALEAARRDAAGDTGVPTPRGPETAAPMDAAVTPSVQWERVDCCGSPRPVPRIGSPATAVPRRGWGR